MNVLSLRLYRVIIGDKGCKLIAWKMNGHIGGFLEICGKRKFHATSIANLVFVVLIFCIVVFIFFQSKGYEISCDCLHLWVQFGPAASIVRIEYDHSMEMGIGVPRSPESFMVGGKLGS